MNWGGGELEEGDKYNIFHCNLSENGHFIHQT